MSKDLERLRRLPKLRREIMEKLKLTVERPMEGSKRLRCLADGVEYDPTGMFDDQGRTNYEKMVGGVANRLTFEVREEIV